MPGSYDLGTAHGRIEIDAATIARTSAALRTLGFGLTAIGVAALAGFGFAVKKAADFEKVMSGAQSALGVTNQQMEIVKKTALDLGANSIYGATQVGKAIEQLAFAGLSVQEITGGAAKATIDLAQASGGLIGLDVAGRTVVNTMRTFGLTTKDTAHIADELAGAANKSTIDIADMVTSLRYVGPVAHTAGIGLDDVAEALAILGDRGIRGSTAGTSLRGVLIGLFAPSKKAAGVLKDLGIITKDGANIMFDSTGKMKSLGEISQILQDHTKGLSKEQKLAAFSAIFQRRAIASALVLAEQGTKGFEHYRKEIAAGGSASDIAAVRLNNLSGDFSLLKSQIETVLIRAGTPFQETLRGWVQGLTGLVRGFAKLSPGVQKFIFQTLAIVGVLFTVAGTMALFASAIIRMVRVFKDAIEGIRVVIVVFQALGAALAANPIVLIVLAIIVLIAILVILFIKVKGFREAVIAAWDAVRKVVVAAWDAIFPTLKAMGVWLGENIPKAVRFLVDVFRNAFNAVKDFFGTGLGKAVAVGIGLMISPILVLAAAAVLLVRNWDSVAQFFSDLWSSIVDTFAPAISFIGDQLTAFGRYFDKNVMPAVRAFGELASAIFERVSEAVRLFWLQVQPVLTLFSAIIRTAFGVAIPVIGLLTEAIITFAQVFALQIGFLVGMIQAVFIPVWEALKGAVELGLAFISGQLSIFVGVFNSIWFPFWDALTSVVLIAWNAIKEIIDAAFQIIAGIFKLFTGLISGDWSKAWEGIKNIFAGIWDLIVAIARAILATFIAVIRTQLDVVVNLFRELPSRILAFFANFGTLLFDKGVALIDGLYQGVVSFWDSFLSFFRNIKTTVLNFFAGAGGWLLDIGRRILQGLIDGAVGVVGKVRDFFGGIKDTITGAFHFSLGPLGIVGIKLIQGLVAGMELMLPSLQNTLQDTVDMVAGIQPSLKLTVKPPPSSFGAASLGPTIPLVQKAPTAFQPATAPTTDSHDIFNLEAHTDADPRTIVDEFMWAKRFRT